MRRDLVGLCLLTSLLFLPGLGARDLWNPSEPAYGLAVVEMDAAGEWLIPSVNGERFLEKPILYFWFARVAGLVGGVSELTLRIPMFLSALVAVLFVYLLGRREVGEFVGRAAALLFLTFISIAFAARQIQMDLPATAAVAATVYYGIAALERPRARTLWMATGLAVGIGFLVRGPVIWVYAAIPLGGAWFLGNRLRFPALSSIAIAVVSSAGVLAVWIVPLLLSGELGVLREAVLRQTFARFVDPWDHVQPWWYYLKYVWIDLAPWSFLLPLAIGLKGRDLRRERLRRLSWVWLIGTLVFFSLSASKRGAYLMPAAPAAALLIAGVVERLFEGTLGRVRRGLALGLYGSTALALPAAGWVVFRLRERYPEEGFALIVTATVLTGAGMVLALTLALRHRHTRVWLAFWVVMAMLQTWVGGWLLPRANPFKSARGFATEVAETVGDDAVSGYRLWKWRADYAFYLERRVGRVRSPEALLAVWDGSGRHCLIVEQWKRGEFFGVLGERVPDVRARVGSKVVELFCNRQKS